MSSAARAAMTAAAVLLGYSVVSALLARGLELAWEQAAWFELGFFFIYLAAGFVAVRPTGQVRIGIAAALAAGFAHGVLGWRITGAIYPSMRIVLDSSVAEFEVVIEFMVHSAVFGAFGATAGWLSTLLPLTGSRPRDYPPEDARTPAHLRHTRSSDRDMIVTRNNRNANLNPRSARRRGPGLSLP